MPPISLVFIGTGLAAWLNGLYFLGMGADKKEGGADPLASVGWVSLAAGILDLLSAWYILTLGEGAVLLAGLIVFYGMFFVLLGVTEIRGLDLRPVGNLSIAVALVPLVWWEFFAGGWMFRSILLGWAVAFIGVALTP